ncbi:MAG: cell wall-binding repeat-containing protein [Coriobacteriia bacterium]|nr:cell wall-binding repeat-containing protein [Coriobacteriia bacterium]MBN2840708.1 cell wall-binding repeat-containing protein [Coriobacteriia bacterium]
MKTLRLIVAVAVALAIATPGVASGAADGRSTSESRAAGIIVKPKPGRDMSALSLPDAARASARIGRSGLYRVAAGRDPDRTLAALRADPAVEWAEPDYLREVFVDYTSWPNDPDFRDEAVYQVSGVFLEHARSWYLRGPGSISADTVWPYLAPAPLQPYGARAAASAFPVGVIDTGFYMDHPDKGSNITAGKDLLDTYTHATNITTTDYDVNPLTPTSPGDSITEVSHGTCVAGEVAAGVNNGVGTVGAGYDTPVRVYKVQGVCVDGIPEYGIDPGEAVILDSAVIDAVYQATDDGCKVITMSLGGPEPTLGLQNAVDYAHSRGVLVLAASGNSVDQPVQYPAACQHVIAVGSYKIDGNSVSEPTLQRSSFTSYGTGLDLLAPGEGIWGFIKPDFDADGPYVIARPGYSPYWSGTSMATPLVAGGAAALWRLAPALTNDQLAGVLFDSARDMGPTDYDIGYGWGAFNMGAARAALVRDYPELPAPTLVLRPAEAISSASTSLSWQAVAGVGVTYRAALDGSTLDLAATTVSYTGLAEGMHTASITAMSLFNWWDPVRSTTTVSFLVDTVTPAAPTVGFADSAITWNRTEPTLKENRVRIDGGVEVVLPGTASSYPLGSLGPGPHVAEVRCVDLAGNASAWGRLEFTLGDLPETPVIASSYTTADGSFTIDWPDALRATSYRYVLDAASPITTVSSSLTLSNLGVGHYRLWVCAVNASGTSEWATATLTVESSPVPPSLTVTSVEGTTETGTDRIGTAIAASQLAFPENSTSEVLIATAFNWPDALGGSALGGALGAPILLTRPDALPDPVIAEIDRLGATHVIVLGGPGAVSADVFDEIDALPGVTVERIAGATRYETARLVAQRAVDELDTAWDGTVLVATGDAFPDALGGSPLSAARGWPVYLMSPLASQQPGLVSALQADGADSALILGGTGAVSSTFETLLRSALGTANVERLGGATRYDTAARIARYGVDEAGLMWDDVALATGEHFPDALAGGVLQGRSGSVMLLTAAAVLPEATAVELRARSGEIHEVRFLGGTGAISPSVRASVLSILER